MSIGLYHFLGLAAALFATGVIGVVTRRNAIGILIGVELMLNACNINLVAFSRFGGGGIDAQVFAIFVIVLAAAEAAVALAIILQLFDKRSDVDVDRARTLRG
ncbi:MAG: NADH-quinone oxidoreductase subunit NuoK [Planctomycetota bacterium]